MNFLSVFVSLITHLGYNFFLNDSIFTKTVDQKKEEKINSSSIFEERYLKLGREFWKFIKKIELHRRSEDISEIKVLSVLPSAQNSHLITQTLLVLNIFSFDPNNLLVARQILSYRELNVVTPFSLVLRNILFSCSCLAILVLIFK